MDVEAIVLQVGVFLATIEAVENIFQATVSLFQKFSNFGDGGTAGTSFISYRDI